ncbi:MAG TPA: hypothetical protein VKA48_07355, partial [Gammaproteobacteria bacterium]|nr:hypothetical protein [Gammaproteobacteria bacterium]
MAAGNRGSWDPTGKSTDELRERERFWNALRGDLERALSRLALFAYEQDPLLDTQLSELRTAIRNGHPAEEVAEHAR